MLRRILQLGLTASLVVLGVVLAARAADPAVRPVLYPAPSEVAEVRQAAPPTSTTTSTTSPATTSTTSEPPSTTSTSTTSEPPSTTSTSTTTTTGPPTTTEAPTGEPGDREPTAEELVVLGGEYGWFERGDRVRELQEVLGLSVDGVYGPATRAAHLAGVEDMGLALDGIPPLPTTTTTTTTEVPVDEEAVLLASYGWNERGAEVRVLQGVLGVAIDGHYGPATRTTHLAENESRGFALDGIPPVPTTTTTEPPPTTTTTEPPPTTTAPSTTEPPPTTTTTEPPPTTTTTEPPSTTTAPSVFGGMGAEIVAQLLGQPCIADGDLSDCPPGVIELVSGLTG